jgi:hypothetical protein
MTTTKRTKEDRRRLVMAYQGNAQVIAAKVEPAGLGQLQHPNRVAMDYRSSNRRRNAT